MAGTLRTPCCFALEATSEFCMSWMTTSCEEPAIRLTSSIASLQVEQPALKISIFSAGCSTCKEAIELVKRIAGSSHEVVIHDMQNSEVASKAKQHGVRSVPAIVIDGKLAGCCAGRGPDEHVLRSALA